LCYLPRGPTIRRWGFAPEPASTCAPSNTLCHRDRISAILDFEFALPEVRVLDVASGLKYSMRIWEHEDPWINGACFSRGYARFVTLTEREISALVDVTILRDTVSVIWHYGRSLAERRPPDRARLEEMRDSTSWLKAHRSEIAALLIAAAPGVGTVAP
jgi:Ser/Thr protein kinase RdoA (MazF antagonist)